MAGEDLAGWWVHPVTVERLAGTGAYGSVFDPPDTLVGFVDEQVKLVRNSEGQEVVSSATIKCSHDSVLPEGSRVTLPSGRVATVIGVHHATGVPGLEHVSADLT